MQLFFPVEENMRRRNRSDTPFKYHNVTNCLGCYKLVSEELFCDEKDANSESSETIHGKVKVD